MILRVGKTYNLIHNAKGPFTGKIVYMTKSVIYAEIMAIESSWSGVKVGDHVRMRRGALKVKKVANNISL